MAINSFKIAKSCKNMAENTAVMTKLLAVKVAQVRPWFLLGSSEGQLESGNTSSTNWQQQQGCTHMYTMVVIVTLKSRRCLLF